MFGQEAGKPVDVIVTESCKIDGEHVERGTVIEGMAPELAMELAGAGKVRAATPEAIKEVKAAVRAAREAAAAVADEPNPMTAMVAAAVTAALQAAGIGGAPKAGS